MKCKECPNWGFGASTNLRKHSEWLDCGCVMGDLDSRLLRWIECPFDPHDVKYHMHDIEFKKLYKKLSRRALPDGVRMQKITKPDMCIDPQSGEMVRKPVNIYYYQTRADHTCTRGAGEPC